MTMKPLPIIWTGTALLALALSVLVGQDGPLPAETHIVAWVQARSWPGDALSGVIRALTGTEVVLAMGGLLVAALVWLRRFRTAGILLAGLIVLPLLQAGIKDIVDRPRPAPPLVELRAGSTSPSYPAGHMMSPTFFYGFLAWLLLRSLSRQWLRLLTLALAGGLLGLSGLVNLWLGVHWPSDILGGWLWGLALLFPVVYLAGRAPDRLSGPSRLSYRDERG